MSNHDHKVSSLNFLAFLPASDYATEEIPGRLAVVTTYLVGGSASICNILCKEAVVKGALGTNANVLDISVSPRW